MKVLKQETAGQCTARNAALDIAAGPWVLFLDDDEEIPRDLIERHLKAIASSSCDVSCGVIDESGALPRDAGYRRRRVSDVFPTGNSLARLEAVQSVGAFDVGLDGGQREDHDLGMRLYLNGCLLIQHPDIVVLHHHSPVGGLRSHKARVTTYGGSRKNLLMRNLPTPSDLYIDRRYHSERQVKEIKWIAMLGTLSLKSSRHLRLLKVVLGVVLLPDSYRRIRKAEREAFSMTSRRDAREVESPSDTQV